jgi:hypothetical protein
VGGVAPTGGAAPGRGAQWDCSFVNPNEVCVSVLGTTASAIPNECPVDPTRPRTREDCAEGTIFTCVLAVTPAPELLLVNCHCDIWGSDACAACSNLEEYHGAPAYCDGVTKVCACAYTGILR